jgi:hypothetical protein
MDDKKQQPLSEKDVDYDVSGDRRLSAGAGRKNSVTPEVIAGELFDERYERTQRGLKSRYVLSSRSHSSFSNKPISHLYSIFHSLPILSLPKC